VIYEKFGITAEAVAAAAKSSIAKVLHLGAPRA
jgi:hypothetical protein